MKLGGILPISRLIWRILIMYSIVIVQYGTLVGASSVSASIITSSLGDNSCDKPGEDALLGYVCQPPVRAFLDTIAYAEGTLNEDGYRIIFGFVLFDSFDDHPRRKICVNSQGRRLCSTAAGKYQINQKTWDWLAPRIQAKDFTPINQDKAAIQLLIDKQALPSIYEGDIAIALDRVKNVWASLPGAPYDQPTKSQSELKKIYRDRLNYYKKKKITLQQLTKQLGYV